MTAAEMHEFVNVRLAGLGHCYQKVAHLLVGDGHPWSYAEHSMEY